MSFKSRTVLSVWPDVALEGSTCDDSPCILEILYPYKDEMRDIRSNITLCLKEFPRAKPKETPEGKGLYLTVYPESRPNTDIISF